MGFEVSPDGYDRFIGRYSTRLAVEFADFCGALAGERVLDVGCGPGALTAELVRVLGPAHVTGVDPSESFVAAARMRVPRVEILRASAEALPFPAGSFDRSAAQLVVHFMTDPVAGLTEMSRVTRRGGVVAACVWDHAGGTGPLTVFWDCARRLDPNVFDESTLAGAREGHLAELFRAARLSEVHDAALTVATEFRDFDDWWQPFTLGIGPAGDHVASLDDEQRAALREECRNALPSGGFELTARAWACRGRVD